MSHMESKFPEFDFDYCPFAPNVDWKEAENLKNEGAFDKGIILVAHALPELIHTKLNTIYPTIVTTFLGEVPTWVWPYVVYLITCKTFPTKKSDAPRLKYIQLTSAGYNHIEALPYFKDIDSSNEIKPILCNASGIHSTPIGEYIFMMLLNYYHQFLFTYETTQRVKRWPSYEPSLHYQAKELRNQTIGIIGYGAIGSEIGRLASCFGMQVLAATGSGQAPQRKTKTYAIEGTCDPEAKIPKAMYTTKDTDSFCTFLSSCDIIVNTAPLNQGTKNLIGLPELEVMKNSAVLVNVGRGESVNTNDLVQALNNKTIRAAILDVVDPEPLPDNHPLFTLSNCFITPHMSGNTVEYMYRLGEIFLHNLQALDHNESLINNIEY